MNNVIYSDCFKRKVKPLSKKYKTLRESIDNLVIQLCANPFLGESYGSGIYKVRLADKSKGKGTSGGFRVMYYLTIETKESTEVLLLTIFDKKDRDTITKKEADKLLKDILKEM